MVDHTTEKLKHVAIGSIIAIVALAIMGTAVISGVASEGLDINESSIKKGSSTQAVFVITVKNVGDSPVSSVKGNISDLPNGTFEFNVLAGTLDVGKSTSFSKTLPNSSTLPAGTSYPVTVNATTSGGNTVIETAVVYVSRI